MSELLFAHSALFDVTPYGDVEVYVPRMAALNSVETQAARYRRFMSVQCGGTTQQLHNFASRMLEVHAAAVGLEEPITELGDTSWGLVLANCESGAVLTPVPFVQGGTLYGLHDDFDLNGVARSMAVAAIVWSTAGQVVAEDDRIITDAKARAAFGYIHPYETYADWFEAIRLAIGAMEGEIDGMEDVWVALDIPHHSGW